MFFLDFEVLKTKEPPRLPGAALFFFGRAALLRRRVQGKAAVLPYLGPPWLTA